FSLSMPGKNVPLRLQVAVFINKKYNSHLQFNNLRTFSLSMPGKNVPLRLQVAVFINKKYNSHLQFNN
ncbi:hypothetical protein L1K73_23610, partial [Salmonella enterica subsp. enterica serovar Anatum]|nr:hypothetical protein [Salmonella enterica subsp. enterica serovar Anatum]